jgi:kinesin family member 15
LVLLFLIPWRRVATLQVVAAQSKPSARSPHIAYRSSKLTFLLKDSLGGNSKTFLIANVSQNETHEKETMSTLHFAQDAKSMRNNAQVNSDTQGSAHSLKAEIARLRAKLQANVR